MAEFDPVAVLRALELHGVRFVMIGGIAARLRGAPLLTEDLDITPDSNTDNLERLSAALAELGARLRTATDPDGVAFPFDPALLEVGDAWTLVTGYGDVDLIFTPTGTAGYSDLVRDADEMTVSEDGVKVLVAALADIIRSKEASGRDKDRAALPLLRRTLEEAGDG